MAIGVVTGDAFEREMRALNIVPDIEHQVNEEVRALVRGRGNKPEVPMEMRALIATEKQAGASSKELQDEFGVSASSVSAYANGATSTATYNDPEKAITDALEASANVVIGKAQKKLLSALDAISESKLLDAKPNVASAVARDMSNIVKNMKPEAGLTINNNKIVVFKPRTREEDEFETIHVIEE